MLFWIVLVSVSMLTFSFLVIQNAKADYQYNTQNEKCKSQIVHERLELGKSTENINTTQLDCTWKTSKAESTG